jgi:hypothetical protein
MLLLTSTSDLVQIVTGTAVSSIVCHTSYVDNASGTITPGRLNTSITTATTATIVASPSSGVQRNVKMIDLSNISTATPCQVTVQHTDGTTVVNLFDCLLQPGEDLLLDATGSWHHHDIQGADYLYQVPPGANLGPTGTLAETLQRELMTETNSTMAASGTLNMQAIYLTAGQTVSNITISSATTAAGTPTHYWFALYSGTQAAPALLASSADQTTAAWAANTVKTLAMSTPYKVPTSGVYYIGYVMVATTVATLKGGTARTGGQLGAVAPAIYATSTTGITTALPTTAAALTTGGTVSFYAAVS